MLRNCEYDGRSLDFVTGVDESPQANKFTVVVGKNGTGKSRLLKAIIENFVDVREFGRRSLISSPRPRSEMRISSDLPVNRVIALSTSPFDRFPFRRGIAESENYQYLGIRGLGSSNLSLSFMSRTLWALLKAVVSDPSQATIIQTVLEYLGYAGFIEARFVCALKPSEVEEMLHDWDRSDRRAYPNSLYGDRFFSNLRDMAPLELREHLETIHKWYQTKNKPRLDLRIDASGVFESGAAETFDESLLPLFKLGFFQLRDVGLLKRYSDQLIRIDDASSGEQCVVMALLGIASHIQDGSLICIDEPEICLHPEWQERYIELLMTSFSEFKGCHFVIATHSPQVVAKLRDQNCFVLDLESGVTTTASAFNGRSADFQLAQVFKAPGFKNEYLSRVLFDALRVIGSGKELESGKAGEVTNLLLLKEGLSQDDPVRGLMEILEKSLKEMGRA